MPIILRGVTAGAEFPTAESYDTLLGALPQMLCWWVPDAARVTKDGANRVSTWADRSTKARTGTQAVAGKRPLWVNGAAPRGWSVLRFDQTRFDAITTNVVFPSGLGAKFTKIALVKLPAEAASNTFREIMAGSTGGDTHRFGIRGVNTLGARVGGSAQLQSHLPYSADVWTLVMSSWDGAIGRIATSLNGAAWVQNSTPNPAILNNDATLTIGTSTNGAGPITGDIADLMVFSVALHAEAPDILAEVKQYFRDRYSLAVA